MAKKILLIFRLLALFFTFASFSKETLGKAEIGVGIVLIDPTGISARYGINRQNSIDAAMAWALGGDFFYLHTDYLIFKRHFFNLDNEYIDLFYGGGLRFMHHDYDRWNRRHEKSETWIGPRAPIGLLYQFRQVPVEVFTQAALILNFSPETSLDLEIGIGARYLF